QIIPNITLRIQAGAIIQGTVVGPDGLPVAGLRVITQRAATVDGLQRLLPAGSGSVTLADGGFQITGLSPGKYSVVADLKRDAFDVGAPSQISWLRTPYPSIVTIGLDEVVPGIDILMRQGPVYSIRGTVAGANAGRLYRVFLQNGTDVATLRMVNVQSDESFSINGIPPGRYGLDLVGPGRPPILEHIEVNVTDQDIPDVRLETKASPEVTARVTAPVGVDSVNVKLFLRSAVNPTAPIVFSQRGAEGVYTFENPSPTPNVVSAIGLPPGVAIRSVKFNGQPAANLVVDLSNGGGQIEVLIGPATSGPQ
ncbi:MAG TPA: carboxypeptidase-like regulatory domain-containing protein, partial [Bryobacteraceae bacterium]|nr:carboxypeptidase-like regulatory domain-containing protein [Bryobacteraceae bacterium]